MYLLLNYLSIHLLCPELSITPDEDKLWIINLEILKKLSLKAQGVRRDGSAALDLCYVACGRYESFWEFGLNPWDMAAGSLISQKKQAVRSQT